WRRSGRFGRLGLGGRRDRCPGFRFQDPDDRLHGYGLPLLHFDLREDARGRCRDFGIDLVGRDLEQRLVPLDGVADLLEPFAPRAFGDGLAHLGHEYVYACHWISVSTPPTSGRLSRCVPTAATRSPRASAHTAAARRSR